MERVVSLSGHTHTSLVSLPVAGSCHSTHSLEVGGSFLLKTKSGSVSFQGPVYASSKWKRHASFLGSFLTGKDKQKNREALKYELLEAIAPLDRGADVSTDDKENVEQIVRDLEAVNLIKEPLNSDLLNGKWELLYTTSRSVLGSERPKLLRPHGKIYQAINSDTLRAQNMETWPFFNQVTANIKPLNARKVAVMFDTFKILGLIPIKAPGRARGELEITYLDDEIRISRGDKGNLFILKMVDQSYRVPT